MLLTTNAGIFIALSHISNEHLFLTTYAGFLLPTKFIFFAYSDFTIFYINLLTSLFVLGRMFIIPLQTFSSSSSCCSLSQLSSPYYSSYSYSSSSSANTALPPFKLLIIASAHSELIILVFFENFYKIIFMEWYCF